MSRTLITLMQHRNHSKCRDSTAHRTRTYIHRYTFTHTHTHTLLYCLHTFDATCSATHARMHSAERDVAIIRLNSAAG